MADEVEHLVAEEPMAGSAQRVVSSRSMGFPMVICGRLW